MIRRRITVSVAYLFLFGIGAYVWMKSAYQPVVPIQVAKTFIDLVHAKQFLQAHALTLKNGYTGKTPKQLEAIAGHEVCAVNQFVRTFPIQSNGNRVRRWLSGNEVDLTEVHVEFDGSCLLRVSVRRNGDQWRVFYFASHAG